MEIEWTTTAEEDLLSIFEFLCQRSPRSAEYTELEIETQTDKLMSYPRLGRPGQVRGTRELVINRTPYLVLYQVDEYAVRILRVIHGAQDRPPNLSTDL